MSDERDTQPPVDTVPVSPNSGLDPEIRQFMGRLMAGYESAHRTLADVCSTLAKRANDAEEIAAKALESQVRVAAEREELLSRKHKRDLEAAAAAEDMRSRAELGRELKTALVLAMKKYVGIPISGNDSHGFQDILKSMTPDQVESLMVSGTLQLNPPQRAMLAATLSSLAESEAKANATPEVAQSNEAPS